MMLSEVRYCLRSSTLKDNNPRFPMLVAQTLLVLVALQFPVIGYCDSGNDWLKNLFESKDKNMPKETLTTLAEAKNINLPFSVDGVNFEVPLTYLFRGYSAKDGGWFAVPEGEKAGTVRPTIDFITIYALLPDLAPLSKANLAEFEELGHGKKVMASLTHMRSWDYYFKNSFKNAEHRPDSPEVPGMLHYYDMRSDMYFSHDYATDDLTVITCRDQNFFHHASPSCKVETSYRPAHNLIAPTHKDRVIFRVEYDFSSQYLSKWHDIDKKLKSLFDQFIRNATQRSSAR